MTGGFRARGYGRGALAVLALTLAASGALAQSEIGGSQFAGNATFGCSDVSVSGNSTATIDAGATVSEVKNITVAAGSTLTVNGTLLFSGTITNGGTVNGSGAITRSTFPAFPACASAVGPVGPVFPAPVAVPALPTGALVLLAVLIGATGWGRRQFLDRQRRTAGYR